MFHIYYFIISFRLIKCGKPLDPLEGAHTWLRRKLRSGENIPDLPSSTALGCREFVSCRLHKHDFSCYHFSRWWQNVFTVVNHERRFSFFFPDKDIAPASFIKQMKRISLCLGIFKASSRDRRLRGKGILSNFQNKYEKLCEKKRN